MSKFPILGWLGKDGKLIPENTIPPYFQYINPTYLKNKGYSSPFFDQKAYFTTYGGNGSENRASMILSTWFRKGDIEIWYGLHYGGYCPPMVHFIKIKNKIIYQA